MVNRSLSSRLHTKRCTNSMLRAKLLSLITSDRLSQWLKEYYLSQRARKRVKTPRCWQSRNSLRVTTHTNFLVVILNCCGAQMRKLSDLWVPTLQISERLPNSSRLKILKLTMACLNGTRFIMAGKRNSPPSLFRWPLITSVRSMETFTLAISWLTLRMTGPYHSWTSTMLRDHGTWSILELLSFALTKVSTIRSKKKGRWVSKSERHILINSSFGWLTRTLRFMVNLSSMRNLLKAANGERISCILSSKDGQKKMHLPIRRLILKIG